MALELTLAKAQEMVEKAIEERGADYIYPKANTGSCTYVDITHVGAAEDEVEELNKGCIVGHIFISELGLNLGTLANSYVNDEGAGSFVEYLTVKKYLTPDTDPEVVDYLERLQRSQDAGRPWGDAHEQAKLGKHWSRAYKTYIEG